MLKKTFKLEIELPLKYHGTFALVAIRERKTVNELLVEILTTDREVKKMQDKMDGLPDMPDIVFPPDSPLFK